MHSSFTPQEQELIDSLRGKYGGLRNGQPNPTDEVDASCLSCSAGAQSARQPEPSSRSSRATSSVEASICPHCHGTGTLVEIYNHRRLENFCKECDGRGVRVFKNGVEVQPGAATAGRGALTSSSAAAPDGVVALHTSGKGAAGQAANGIDGPSSDDEESVAEKAAVLQKDLQRISTKVASYTKERFDALAILQQPHSSGIADSEGHKQAARDLVAQLDLQLERLELARRKKQLMLDRLTAIASQTSQSANITLSDIIANEGVRM
ncbi:hypothetical protein Vretimale_10818 [Volvox reticuliferus]|uniref:Uncharacterized protein n=1 Tax=Volvox reticuliferus TaxID=1737510 RepID=A0A8J4LRP8_9CHLO|nr:hypothetical protein Vretifemale_13775 [Volvox reticuliferus]GIM06519.1 hypothetical protein Vretimale_10818 [Volvox reticuliferus]